LYSAQKFSLERDEAESREFPNDFLTYYQMGVGAFMRLGTDFQETGLVSQMGRVNYGYDDRYLVTLTTRRDGYSGFGENYKYGVFPSLALGWNVSNEAWWPFYDRVNALKLRLSYGKNGNQA